MDFLEVVQPAFTYAITIILVTVVSYVGKKVADFFVSMKDKTDSETVSKTDAQVREELLLIVNRAVTATNQTFVNIAKKNGTFDESAQKEAVKQSIENCLAMMTQDMVDYVAKTYGDVDILLTTIIESMIDEVANKIEVGKDKSKVE